MILYLDASALVKRYVEELVSVEVAEVVGQASIAGTALISRAEVSAALAKAVRTNALTFEEAFEALKAFRAQWASLVRVRATEPLIARADDLAWQHGLRGHDAVHLAAALIWRDALNVRVTMATFDRLHWKAASQTGPDVFPSDLPALLEEWQYHRGVPSGELNK